MATYRSTRFIANHKEVNSNLAIKLLETYQKSGKNVSLIISFAIEEYQSFMSCPNRYKYEKSSNKEQEVEETNKYKNLTTWFYELLPMAILYGMSIDEFWNQDPDLFWAYRYAYFERLEIEQSIFNYNAWLQGAYFHEALSVSLCNAFSKQKAEYSKKPYDLIRYESKEDEKMKKLEMQVTDVKARITQINRLREEVGNICMNKQ